jgi:DNA-binding Lrp family transcriptional regulator
MFLDEIDRNLLAEMEKGLTLTGEPFNEIARELGITPKEVVARLILLKEKGVIRRFGASIKPNSIGFSANALVAWKVPGERVEEIGEYMSKFQEVSHCYERKPVSGRWEYNLYTVMHAREREGVERMVNQISEWTGISEYEILFSTRDLKRSNLSLGGDGMISPQARSKLVKNIGETNDP